MRWETVAEGLAQCRREMSARLHRDVEGKDIARAVGVTPAAYSRWERGQRVPSEDDVRKLAAFFEVSPAYLRYGLEAPSEEPLGAPRRLTAQEIADARARVAARPDAPPADPPARPARRAAGDRKPPKRRPGGR